MRPSPAESRRHSTLTTFSTAALFWLLLGGSSITWASPISSAGSYSLQNLGSLGSSGWAVSAINGSGVAVGFVTDQHGNSIPVSLSGQANALAGYGEANGINSAGTIVGTTFSTGNNPSVTEWSNGKASNPNIAGYGTSINDAGTIAGGYQAASGQLHAFTWTDGNLVDLGTLGGSWSSAYAIDAAGAVAGTSTTATGRFAAFFSSGNGLINLGTLGGANSYAMGLNDAGVVVGNAQTAQGYLHGFEWDGGAEVDLGTLGGSQSYAYGVNDAGTAVGYSYIAGNSATHGFMYSNGILLDLNSLLPIGSGWTIEEAYGINNAGDILGVGMLNGQTYAIDLVSAKANSTTHYFEQPLETPEPAALLLTGAGLVLIGKVTRRTRKRQSEIAGL